ncbi:CLUMA_CG015871, isoform A, partial [Clunio marinus]
LQECQTDSEELIYQAPSACSAPPDFLITNNQPQQSQAVVAQTPSSVAESQQNQQQSKPVKAVKVKDHQVKEKMSREATERLQKRHSIATTRHLEALEENRVHLDEFTCDVSVEDSNEKPQPIQFSFTLYDLDGHGKITKDDIAGIVSTIYDSIGKTVVVPHYGKKTINVKLTVSPDAKQQQQQQQQPATNEHIHQQDRTSKKLQLTPRRRYRPRALLSDDDDSESTSDNLAPFPNEVVINNSMKASENLNNDKNNMYESINNLKCCNQSNTIDNLFTTKNNKNIEIYKNCQPCYSPERLHIHENNVNYDTKCHKKHIPNSKKKLLRRSRSRRHQRSSEVRVRSLSVGNDHKWRRQQQVDEKETEFISSKDCKLNNGTNLRRDELIEIIKDSMEKNRLCFQGNRKTENVNGTSQMRQRSNTVTCTNKLSISNTHCNDTEQHLCAFDSFLHATICSNAHVTSQIESTKIVASKMNNRNRMKQMNQSMPPALKLKTSVLNHLNPNLTPEQKLTRKLNDVEKWLLERDTTTHSYKIENEGKIRSKDDKNILNPIVVDKLSAQATLTPKKVFNKELLLSKKLKPLGHQSKQQKEVINSSKNQIILEYSNVPVPGDVSECENLLISDDDQSQAPTAILVNNKETNDVEPEAVTPSNASDSTTKSSSVRFVHIHHHFYHFNEKNEQN